MKKAPSLTVSSKQVIVNLLSAEHNRKAVSRAMVAVVGKALFGNAARGYKTSLKNLDRELAKLSRALSEVIRL
jgi:hypothetical protein